MRNRARTFAFTGALALVVVACNKPSEGGAPAASATPPSATASATAATTAVAPPPTASAAAAAPSAAGDALPGAVRIHLDSAKVVSGKADAAEKTLKTNMLKLRTECIAPALKKPGTIDGTLKAVIELGPDGKASKVTTSVPTGKVPDEVASCVKSFYEKNAQIDTNKAKAKVEVTLAMGPNVQPDK